jgi:hypothetical protein
MSDRDESLVYVDLIEEEPLTEGGFAQSIGVTVDELTADRYSLYVDRFQPFRLIVRSGGNQRTMFRSSERYHNRSDAERAAMVCFGPDSNVFLRQNEQGNLTLRLAVKA